MKPSQHEGLLEAIGIYPEEGFEPHTSNTSPLGRAAEDAKARDHRCEGFVDAMKCPSDTSSPSSCNNYTCKDLMCDIDKRDTDDETDGDYENDGEDDETDGDDENDGEDDETDEDDKNDGEDDETDEDDKNDGEDDETDEDDKNDGDDETDEKDDEDRESHLGKQTQRPIDYDDISEISDAYKEIPEDHQNDTDEQADDHEQSDSEDQDGEQPEKQLDLTEFLALRESSRAATSQCSALISARGSGGSPDSNLEEHQSDDTSLKRLRSDSSTSAIAAYKRYKPSLTLEEENIQLKLKLAECVVGSHGPMTELRQLIDESMEKASNAERRAIENERQLEAMNEPPS
ncbi:hypothetical protein B0J13DRAFT_647631 [Dactylonectria estremocensis]|uniref:Uncharacterized protein n=1 Tax=Dactylonectria estremocensis TaxID=1079267 RepID=A0A9P9DPL7_9HYPO|nr:hypothetical protein B0J13DRAFT_647631 [Dactylonectria estremocensis]